MAVIAARSILAIALLLPAAASPHGIHSHRSSEAAPAPVPATEAQAEAALRTLIKAYPALAARVLADHLQGKAADPEAAREMRTRAESDRGGFAVGASEAQARIVVVNFFDYHCGPCKRATQEVLALADAKAGVRVVLKEFPVLADESRIAARAALAARAQGRYLDFHRALMSTAGVLTEARVMEMATRIGLDTRRLRQDMQLQALERDLDANLALADSMGIKATPTFLVNGEVLPGRDPYKLEQLMKKAREDSSNGR